MTHPAKVGIAAIFKNEAPYVIEWLAHHRLMGISRFFIADNDSTDGTTELLEALQRCGYLNLIHSPTQPGVKPQMPAYMELMAQRGGEVDGIGIIDADKLDRGAFVGRDENEEHKALHSNVRPILSKR